MPLQIADLAVDKVYVGADPVSHVYIGSDLVWQALIPGGSYTYPSPLALTSVFQVVPLVADASSAPSDAGVIMLPAGSYSAQMSVTVTTNWRSDFRVGWRTPAGDALGPTNQNSAGLLSNTFAFTLAADGPVSLLMRSSPNRTIAASGGLVCTITKT
jgi:hypothetical protein